MPHAKIFDNRGHPSTLLVSYNVDGLLVETGLGENFNQILLGEVSVGRGGEFSQGIRPPVVRMRDVVNIEELKNRE